MALYKLPHYDQHPIAAKLMPSTMTDVEFSALVEDIKQRGVLFPVTLFEGKILDGNHRYRAAAMTGDRVDFVEYMGKDPEGYIASCNIFRRKLSSLQRALVAAKLHRNHGLTQRDACKRFGISNEAMNLVLKAIDLNNARIMKRLETDSDYGRGELLEDLTDAGAVAPKKAKAEPEDDDLEKENGAEPKPKKPRLSAAEDLCNAFIDLSTDERIEFMGLVWPAMRETMPEAFVPAKEDTDADEVFEAFKEAAAEADETDDDL